MLGQRSRALSGRQVAPNERRRAREKARTCGEPEGRRSPNPGLSLVTPTPNEINNLEGYFRAYGTTSV